MKKLVMILSICLSFAVLAEETEYQCTDRSDCMNIKKRMLDAEIYTSSAEGTLPESFYEVERQALSRTGPEEERDDEAPARLYRLAANIYRDLCDKPIADACYFLGSFYKNGNGVEADSEKALALFSKSCSYGNSRACNSKAKILAYQDPRNEEELHQLLEKSCYSSGYDVKACFDLFKIKFEDTSKSSSDYSEIMKLLDRSCFFGGGHVPACKKIGDFYKEGVYVERNYTKALSYYEAMCKGKKHQCQSLSQMYKEGLGVNKDPYLAQRYLIMDKGDRGHLAEITELFKQSCIKLNDATSCRNTGVSYANGWGVEKDFSKAYVLFDKSCILKDEQGCIYKNRLLVKEANGEIELKITPLLNGIMQ